MWTSHYLNAYYLSLIWLHGIKGKIWKMHKNMVWKPVINQIDSLSQIGLKKQQASA